MNVSLKNIDATKGIVKLEIVKADYADKVEKSLRSFRQKAEMPGFRKGMVPMGMVKKMYGKHVLVEEINKLVSENLYNYIRENKLNILGEPLPNETEQKEINFDTQEDFEFCFDVALAPEIKIELSKNDKVPYYQVNIDDEMIGKQVEAYQANFGTYDQVEDVEEKDFREIKRLNPDTTVEVLIPDFQGRKELVAQVIDAQPEIISHNMETVRRISPLVRSAAKYETSLEVLRQIAESNTTTKSGIMVGLGETPEEVEELMDDLRRVGCHILTIGQYLQPTHKHYPVAAYITPKQFALYREKGLEKGFQQVESAPLVRSSYHAEKQIHFIQKRSKIGNI